jgi:hypothetical protein
MADDLARAHAARVHRDDPVVESGEAALILGDQLRIKPGLAVARNLQLDLAGIGDDRLLAITISSVARLFAGEMMVHLGVENSFRQDLLQIVEQPVRVENRLRVGASQQLVGYTRVFASRHRWARVFADVAARKAATEPVSCRRPTPIRHACRLESVAKPRVAGQGRPASRDAGAFDPDK